MASAILYVNADIAAPSRSENPAALPPVQYSQTFTVPLVSRQSDYWLSVLRFSSVGHDVPLFVSSVEVGQRDPRRTTYVVGMSMTPTAVGSVPTFSASRNVQWAPQVQGQQEAPPPLTQQYISGSRWYYSYDYQWVVALVNQALEQCYLDVSAQFEAWWASSGQTDPYPGLTAGIPALTYSASSDLFTYAVRAGQKGELWQYAFNEPARQLFNHLPCAAITPAAALPYALQMPAAPDADGYLRLQQQRSSTDAWSPVGAICLCTNLPIVGKENTPPNVLGAGDAVTGAGRAVVNVLTDVALPLTRGDEYLGLVSYAPVERRRVQLLSGQPLNTVSFSLFWKHRLSGELIPLGVAPDGSVSVKACLERRY